MKSKTLYIVNLLVALLALLPADMAACTSAIVSGKLTKDGRPIMWKNRDTSDLNNCLQYFSGERYNYVAVVGSSSNKNSKSVWMGTNDAGFSIMNTMSYNLQTEATLQDDNNGSLMKRALEVCATVQDFRVFLDTLSRPMLVCSNFGTLDAQGGAAYFETGNTGYVMVDVNDPEQAPEGFVVRTNFSFSGPENEGMGYVRYEQAYRMISLEAQKRDITPRWIFDNLSRSFVNPLMGIDLTDGRFNKPYTNGWFCEEDFIARRKTSSAVVVQGVNPGEDPSLTVMWTIIGYPPVTPAIPVWVKGAEEKLPALVTYNEEVRDSKLCHDACQLRSEVYSYKKGENAEDYFNWELLYNAAGTGLMQQTRAFEDGLYKTYGEQVSKFFRKGKVKEKDMYALYDWADGQISGFYPSLKTGQAAH